MLECVALAVADLHFYRESAYQMSCEKVIAHRFQFLARIESLHQASTSMLCVLASAPAALAAQSHEMLFQHQRNSLPAQHD